MDSDVKLTIELQNRRPVELVDFSLSMVALGDEYQRYAAAGDGESRLYIRGLRDGSIIADLVPAAIYASSLLPEITEHAKRVIEFARFFKDARDFLLGAGERPERLDKKSLQNISQFLEPVAKDGGSQMNIAAVNFNGAVNLHYTVSSVEASAIQNAAGRALALERPTITGIHKNVSLYWAQARSDPMATTGDRAVIERFSSMPVKVRFPRPDLKVKMLYEPDHPFSKLFIVDVAVETFEGRPVLYQVLELHEIIDRE